MSDEGVPTGNDTQLEVSSGDAASCCNETQPRTVGQFLGYGADNNSSRSDTAQNLHESHESHNNEYCPQHARGACGDDGAGRAMQSAREQGDDFARDVERLNESDGNRAVVVPTEGAPNVNLTQKGGELVFAQEANFNQTHHHNNQFRARNTQYNVYNYYGPVQRDNVPSAVGDDQASCASVSSRSSKAEIKEQSRADWEREKELFVETQFYRDAVDLVSRHGVLVITGPPGSGKSTTARAVLRHYMREGFQPLVLHRYEEWRHCVGKKTQKQIVLLEHVFGNNRLNMVLLEEWSRIAHIAKDFASKQDCRVLTLFTIRNHIALHMKRMGNEIKFPILDSSATCLTENEKIAMIHKQLDHKEETVSKAELHDILIADKSGAVFPWCCSEYAETRATNDDASDLFLCPAMAFVQTIQTFLHVKENLTEVISMVADTMVQLKTLDSTHGPDCLFNDVLPSKRREFERHEIGTYILCNGGSFPCRVLYDALGIALGRSLALPELLRVCDTRFLVEHVHTDDVATFHSVCVDRDSGDYQLLLHRVVGDIVGGHLPELCQHTLLNIETFLSTLDFYCEQKHVSTKKLTKTVDRKHGLPFLYWSFFASTTILTQWCLEYHAFESVSFDLLLKLFFTGSLITVSKTVTDRLKLVLIRKKEQKKKSTPFKINLPIPSEEECFTHEINKKCSLLIASLKHFTSSEADIPASLLTVDIGDDVLHLTSYCKTWYLAYRLVSDREVDQKDEAGDTLLQLAVEAGDLNLVQFLIDHGACVIPLFVGDKSYFATAVRQGNDKIAERLFQENNNLTLLCGNVDEAYTLIRELAKHGRRFLKFAKHVPSCLHMAASRGDLDVLCALVDSGLNVNERDSKGSTPLHIAIEKGHLDIAASLLSMEADVNIPDCCKNTALHYACLVKPVDEWQRQHIIKKLLKKKSDINAKNIEGRTPLHVASFKKNLVVIEILLKNKDPSNTVYDDETDAHRSTPLQEACQSQDVKVVKTLLAHGVKCNTVTDTGSTPLHIACENGNARIVSKLLQHGAHVNTVNNTGHTSLYVACEKGHANIGKILLENKANVNAASNGGMTPLCAACLSGHHSVVQTLLHSGADINVNDKQGFTLLHYASQGGNVDVVTLLLDHGAKANTVNNDGFAPLHLACYKGHDNIVSILLENKANVNSASSDGTTPLRAACQGGQHSVVQTLLHSGADISVKDKQGWTPLHYASQVSNLGIMTLLIDHEEEVNTVTDDGFSPLYIACCHGREEVVKQLLQHRADVNAVGNTGRTPLFVACEKGHDKIVSILLQNKVNVNAASNDGATPLHEACLSGHRNIVRTLLHSEADISVKDKDGFTPLHCAIQGGNVDIVTLLLAYDALVNAVTNDGCSPLYSVCHNGRAEVVKLLLQYGADVNTASNTGHTPLDAACETGHDHTVRILLENKANVNAASNDGMTPLYSACLRGHYNVVQTLLHGGANISVKDEEGWTPLHCASQDGNVNVATLLLDHGAEVNTVIKLGFSPLYIACCHGREEVVKQLLQLRADVNAVGNNGRTPLHVACDKGHDNIVSILLENKANVNAASNDGSTPLCAACTRDNINVIEMLLLHGADVKVTNKMGWTPLSLISHFCNVDIVNLLVKQGADVNVGDTNKDTPLRAACFEFKRADASVTQFIAAHDADIKSADNYDESHLHWASGTSSNTMAVSQRLELGADSNFEDNDLWTALHCACGFGHLDTASVLIHHGAQLNLPWSPLHVACLTARPLVVTFLLQHHAQVNVADRDGTTPLHVAAFCGLSDVVRALLQLDESGQRVDVGPTGNTSSLHNSGSEETVKVGTTHNFTPSQNSAESVLTSTTGNTTPHHDSAKRVQFDKRGNTSSRHNNDSPVTAHIETTGTTSSSHNRGSAGAMQLDTTKTVQLETESFALPQDLNDIIEKVDVNMTDKDGMTALHYACRNGHSDVVSIILQHGVGVDLKKRNNEGLTALDCAVQNGWDQVAKAILEHTA